MQEEEVKIDQYPKFDQKKASFDQELYYRQMQDLQNYETCKKCSKAFTKKEEQENQKIMILSTDCYHLVHRECFKDLALR